MASPAVPPAARSQKNGNPAQSGYPAVTVNLCDVSCVLRLAHAKINRDIDTFGGHLLGLASTPLTIPQSILRRFSDKDSNKKDFYALQNISATFRPGTMTLILAPPGHGKSSLLKLIAGRLAPTVGTVKYSGKTEAELRAMGVNRKLLTAYVDQFDVNFPHLTVEETIMFAWSTLTVDPSTLRDPALEAEARSRVDRIMDLLSLKGCANTILGDEMVKGASGGERRRVSIAEALVSNARVLALDEYSTGLDSSVTFKITSGIRSWAQSNQGTVVATLQQATPEVFDLFDDVILLREGRIIYHGPRDALPRYLAGQGFSLPANPRAPQQQNADNEPLIRSNPKRRLSCTPTTTSTTRSTALASSNWKSALFSSARTLFAPTTQSDATSEVRVEGDAGIAGASDIADWLISVITNPDRARINGAAVTAEPSPTLSHNSPDQPSTTTSALAEAWLRSSTYADIQAKATAASTAIMTLDSPLAKAQFGVWYARPLAALISSLLIRQWKLTMRNLDYVLGRLVGTAIVGIILGTVWLKPSNPLLFFGMLVFVMFLVSAMPAYQIGFGNTPEIPVAVESKYVAFKQIAAGMYPSYGFAISAIVISIPICLTEALLFSFPLYFMSALVTDAARFFFFVLVLLLTDIAMGSFFRFVAYLTPTLDVANVAQIPFMALQLLFAGFLITPSKMGWMHFLHYCSLFAYSLRSLSLNEFLSSKYADTQGGKTQGEAILGTFEVQTNPAWLWGGVAVGVGFLALLSTLSCLALEFTHIDRNIGTARQIPSDNDDQIRSPLPDSIVSAKDVAVDMSADDQGHNSPAKSYSNVPHRPAQAPRTAAQKWLESDSSAPVTNTALSPSASVDKAVEGLRVGNVLRGALTIASNGATSSTLPFMPMSIAWRDLRYTVNISARAAKAGARETSDKVLLQSVSGYASPGEMTALMGASGAGKTTLLDVIAGRKNSGKIEGAIYLNGFHCDPKAFARLTAYCEQIDIHAPYTTVEEALNFSAALRLDSTVSAHRRKAFVAEIMNLLELTPIKDRLVGEPGSSNALGPGQRKVLTVGVELASNCPILFLDEPTSGLDAVNAALVMRVIRNIANTGRTVVTTIHQPSKELFFLFDNLLLLQSGGWQAYFGSLGHEASHLVRYLQARPHTPRLPPGTNPASWMLDVLSAPVERSLTVDVGMHSPTGGQLLQTEFYASSTWAAMRRSFEANCTASAGAKAHTFPSIFARNWFFQLYTLIVRTGTSYWRNVDYNWTRWVALVGLMVFFGTVYYQIAAKTTDFAGLQSLASVVYIGGLFVAILVMVFSFPNAFKDRAVFYRERASFMYSPEIHTLATFIVECAWVWFIVWFAITILYFMCGFRADASTYFFYIFVVWLSSLAFYTFGQILSSALSSINAAQTIGGAFIALFFLFGGLFIPFNGLPTGWHWAYYLDPLAYMLEAIVSPQLHCFGDVSSCQYILYYCGSDCPPGSVYYHSVPLEQAFQDFYGLYYDRRWRDMGILVGFVGGFLSIALFLTRYVVHQKR